MDPSVIQTALLQVADATKAAVQAAQLASQAQSSGSQAAGAGARPGGNVDWSKLLNKPNVFDNKTAEEDIRNFRDWHWQLCQYLTAVDEGLLVNLLKRPHMTKPKTLAFDDPKKKSFHPSETCTLGLPEPCLWPSASPHPLLWLSLQPSPRKQHYGRGSQVVSRLNAAESKGLRSVKCCKVLVDGNNYHSDTAGICD